MPKQARKVSLIAVADYPRTAYSAHWEIMVDGDDAGGYRWSAQIIANDPVAWNHQGARSATRPAVSAPQYPADLPRLPAGASAAEIGADMQAQEARRRECARIYEAAPKPVYLIDESAGRTATRDEADTTAQQWVLDRIKSHRIAPKPPAGKPSPPGRQNGNALPIGPGGMLLWSLFAPLDRLFDALIYALGYSTTIRNERVQRVQINIDLAAGAGLFRIYDGARPATGGAATTKLAELTFTDPCAPGAAAGVLTFSAITADASADATGTATWFRAVDSTGTFCVDGNVGTSGSDLNLNSTSIAVGQQVAVSSFTITGGNA